MTSKCVGCGKTVGGMVGAFGENLPAGAVCLTCRNKIRPVLGYQYLSEEEIKAIVTGKLAPKDARPQILRDLIRAELHDLGLTGPSAADELAKYKDLLDRQAITPEEYETKKKELLKERTAP